MTQQEFHAAYQRMPDDVKAELIGGIVYVASPLRIPHGTHHPILSSVLVAYQAHTPGVEVADNTTVILGDESEPQPDLYLRTLPEFGGQSRTTDDDYVRGAPELVAEIAHSSRALDLHAKHRDYTRHGVLEYLVLTLDDRRLRWFDLPNDRELPPDPDGVCRLRTFPGLWVHADALLARDYGRLMTTLQQGLATPEHAAFVEKLAAAGRSRAARP
jgi:Uma2 family endonuclease